MEQNRTVKSCAIELGKSSPRWVETYAAREGTREREREGELRSGRRPDVTQPPAAATFVGRDDDVALRKGVLKFR